MNKRTRAIDEDTYKLIIATMKNGFVHEGVQYKPNERIATVLVLEYNLGLRVGDILQLKVDNFVKDGSRYRIDIYEQKTGKYRNFTVPNEVYQFVTHRIIFALISKPIAWFDRHIVDGALNGLANGTNYIGESIRPLQSGRLQQYAYVFLMGIIVLFFIMII